MSITSLPVVCTLCERRCVPVLLTTGQAEETHVMKSHKWSACVREDGGTKTREDGIYRGGLGVMLCNPEAAAATTDSQKSGSKQHKSANGLITADLLPHPSFVKIYVT